MNIKKWISTRSLGFALAVMMLLSCVVLVPDEIRETTHVNNSALALGTTVPTAPLNLVADAGNQFVWLWWDHPASQGSDLIKNYTIYRNATSSTTVFVKLDTVQIGFVLPYNDSNVLNGLQYTYKITADSDAGASPDSNVISVTPVASATPPGAVQNLVALNQVYATQLNWSAPANAGSTPVRFYYVYSPGVFGFPDLTVLPSMANGYHDTNVLPGKTYNYTVRAVSSTWGATNASISRFIGGTGDIPGSPMNLTASGSNNSVTLSWDNPANPSSHGLTNYTVLRSDSQSGSFSYIGNVSTLFFYLPFFSDSTAINGHKYYYKVVSNNLFGPSAPSNIANATPAYEPPTPFAAAYPGNGQVLLVWSSLIFNGTGIDIYRSIVEGARGNIVNSSLVDSRFYWYDNSTTNGVKYYYTVRANLSNVYLFSNQVNATPFVGTVLSAPTGLIATPDSSSVGLYAKLASSTNPIIGYSIYRGNSSGAQGAIPIKNVSTIGLFGLFSSTSLTTLIASDGTALEDVDYFYTVSVRNMFGESAHSNEAMSFASFTGDVPMRVTDLSATGGTGQVTLTWSNPTYQGTANLLYYEILRYNGTAWSFAGLVATGLGQQTFVDTNLTPGTYGYYILVSNNYGDALLQSNIAEATTTSSNVAPSAPINLITTNGTGYIVLSWTAPATVGPGITSYKIFRGATSGGEGTTVFQTVSGTSLTYNDTTVTPGLPYYYEVAAVNSVATGPDSNEAVGMAPAPSAPSAPLNLTAFAGQGQIILNWSAPSSVGTGITEYRVFRATTAGGEGTTPIASTTGTTLTYIDVNIASGSTYYYEVRAVNSGGLGPESNEVVIIAEIVVGIPSPPTGLTAVAGNGYILLNWTAPSNAGGSVITSYKVYRGTSASGEEAVPIASPSAATLTYNDSSAMNQIPYYYVVKAVNSNGTSNPSNEVTATPVNLALPSAPKNVIATPGAGKVVIIWDAPDSVGASPITGYNVYRSDNGSQLTLLNTTIGTTTTYTDNAVVPGHSYGYQIVAKNTNGNGTASSVVTAIPNAISSTPSTDNTLLYAGIVVVVVAILGGGAFLFLRRKK
ncbi:MAG TPA: fibronectin type III domain-containing protein [Methanomassiliicoccales archaeon]|jgi:fibronectin type 3 domain-containing protein